MGKKALLRGFFLVFALSGSVAFGLDFMGPPAAGLDKGQLSLGSSYSYSRMDVDIKGDYFGNHVGSTIELPKKLKMNKYYSVLAYGLEENSDVYLLLGSVRNKTGIVSNIRGTKDVDSDSECAIGFGAKRTFYEEGPLKLGGLYQMSWVRDIDINERLLVTNWYHTVEGELDLTEIQIAVGPSYQLNEFVSIYGGPFFHFIYGDFSYSESCSQCGSVSGGTDDVREASWFGGYIGAQVELIKKAPFNIEWQHTAYADAVAMSITWRF